VDCGAQTLFEGFTQRTLTDADWSEFQGYREAFVDGELAVRPLVRALVTSDAYKARGSTDREVSDRLATVRVASPAQLATIIEDITGYRWSFGGVDGLTEHDLGLPGLAGGIDGRFLTERSYEPGVGAVFVLERLAWSAAWTVARHDLDPARTDDATLLAYVTADDRPDSAGEAFASQLRHLLQETTGLPVASDDPRLPALETLWRQVHSVDADPVGAWATVLSAVLRDPRVLTY
jgi:hypothetical protein